MKRLFLTLAMLFTITNLIAQWYNNYNTGYDMKAVSFPVNSTGWAVGANNTIIKTTNAGETWFTQNSGLPLITTFSSVLFDDTQTGYIAGYPYSGIAVNAVFLKTTNGGVNWQQLSVPATGCILTDIFLTTNDKSIILCGYNPNTNDGIILKSVNSGANWTVCYNNPGKVRRLFFTNNVKGYAGGDKLLKTDDKGSTWSVVTDLYSINDLYFETNQKDGWICTESGLLYSTNDRGVTWQQQFQNLNHPLNSMYFVSSSVGYVCSADGKIFKTTNGGEHWTRQVTNFSNSLNDLCMMNSGTTGFAVGNGGVILRTVNGGGIITSDNFVIKRNSVDKPIEPNQWVRDTIVIPSAFNEEFMTLVDVNVSIDTVLTTMDGNLLFTITHAGVTDTIINKVGGTGKNFIETWLDDEADNPIEEGRAPFTGTYKPSYPLTCYNNMPVSGEWVLSIYQDGPGLLDPLLTGVIKSWGMGVTSNSVLPGTVLNGENNHGRTPASFKLYQNYPNPFNPETKIRFDLNKNEFVNVTVFDITGRAHNCLVNKTMTAGTYDVPWNAGNYNSGVYFCRVTAGDYSETRKMILVK